MKQYRANDPKCHNPPTLFFHEINRNGNALEVGVKKGEYADYVATIQSLNQSVTLADGREQTVSDLLATGWDAKSNLLPLPVASPVMFDLMILTNEDTIMVSDDRRCQRWNVSASAITNLASDADANDITDVIGKAIRRRAHEELGLLIDSAQISWMAFGVGRKLGHTGFIGQIKLLKSEEQVLRSFENRTDRDEVQKIEFIPLEIPAVRKFLKTRDCLWFLHLALHLCLWRKFPKRVSILTS